MPTGKRTSRLGAVVAVAVALLGAAGRVQAQAAGPQPAGLQWSVLDNGLRMAKAQKKGVFVMVYADWCGYCHRMEATTFRDPQIVAKLTASFVPVKLNGESGRTLSLEKGAITESRWALQQGVQGFPSLIALDSKGRTVAMYPGYLTSPQTAQFLGDLAEFLRLGGIDKLGDFFEWVERSRS